MTPQSLEMQAMAASSRPSFGRQAAEFLPHLASDDELVKLRRSELKSLHDGLVRGVKTARACEDIAAKAVNAFAAEARQLETLANEFAAHIESSGSRITVLRKK